MALLRIERVLALPGTLSGSTMYVVAGAAGDAAELYFTNTAGDVVRHLITEAEINDLINNAIANFSNILLVADIAARDALTPDHNSLVLVLDGTGDPTVISGAALYFYNVSNTTWYKISEFESLDVSLTWASLENKPSSSVADIDDAVSRRHSHANKAELDKVGEDADGKLTYNGVNPEAYVAVANW